MCKYLIENFIFQIGRKEQKQTLNAEKRDIHNKINAFPEYRKIRADSKNNQPQQPGNPPVDLH